VVAEAHTAGMEPPAIVVVGEIVSVRERIRGETP
jgi:hypothetical protein